VLSRRGEKALAVELLREGQGRHPEAFWLNWTLANVLTELNEERPGGQEEAIGFYRAALALRPQSSAAYTNLGNALLMNQDLAAALDAFQKAIALDPKNAIAHNGLGSILNGKKDLEGAKAAYRKAIELDPGNHLYYYNLGNALKGKNELDAAI